jgi:hypothetical protein
MGGAGKVGRIAALMAMAHSMNGGLMAAQTEVRKQTTEDLMGPRKVHATKRNTTRNKMKRGGHTFIFGHPNEYKEPKVRRVFASNSFIYGGVIKKLRSVLFGRKKAKAARAARKVSRPTY